MKNSPETLRKRNELKRMWKKKIDPKSFSHFENKICKDCGKKKPCQWQYSFTQTGIPEYRARCTDCQKIYFHKVKTTDDFRKRRNEKRKIKLLEFKRRMVEYLGGKCKKCDYKKSLAALTFHHRDPQKKEYGLGSIKDNKWFKIKKELDKCDLLCFNCHMELYDELNNKIII